MTNPYRLVDKHIRVSAGELAQWQQLAHSMQCSSFTNFVRTACNYYVEAASHQFNHEDLVLRDLDRLLVANHNLTDAIKLMVLRQEQLNQQLLAGDGDDYAKGQLHDDMQRLYSQIEGMVDEHDDD